MVGERGTRKQLPRGNMEAKQYSSSGILSTCRWKAIYPHWKHESLEAPSPGIEATVKSKVGLAPAECISCLDLRNLPRTQRLGNTLPPGQGQLQKAILPKAVSQPFSQSGTRLLPTPSPPVLARCCLHDLGGETQQEGGDSLHGWYYHFLMFYKKGKANFYLRGLMWSRRDHVPWDRLHSDGPLPLESRGRAGSGLK